MANHYPILQVNTSSSTNIGLNENTNINKENKMIDKFGKWFTIYNTEFTWFLIGWLAFATLEALGRGQYVFAVIDAALAYFNYVMWKRNV